MRKKMTYPLLLTFLFLCGIFSFAETINTGVESNLPVLSKYLSTFDQATKENALIHITLSKDASSKEKLKTTSIESKWKSGKYESAIEELKTFELAGTPVSLGVSWKKPTAMGFSANLLSSSGLNEETASTLPEASDPIALLAGSTDSRIGGVREGSSQIILDKSRLFEKIYAAVRWTFLTTPSWSLNISSDGGVTWSEVYNWVAPSGQVVDIDMTEVEAIETGHVYVAYIWDGLPDEVQATRFTANGTFEYSDIWFEETQGVKRDIALDSYIWRVWIGGADGYWLYYTEVAAAVIDDNSLRYFRGDGGSNTGVDNAISGLDFYAFRNSETNTHHAYASYIGTDGRVHVWRQRDNHIADLQTFTGTNQVTAMTLTGWGPDSIMLLFEDALTNGQGIRYVTSSNGGDTWWGQILVEPEAGEGDYGMPALIGSSAVYSQGGTAYFRRYYSHLNKWLDPVPFNDHSCYPGGPLAITDIPYIDGESYSYGLGYIHRQLDGMFYRYYPYFDRAPGPGGYCHAYGDVASIYIRSVNVGSIDNVTPYGWRYFDYTYLSTVMESGYGHDLTVTSYNDDPSDQEQCVVWIDWNQDKDFEDADETITMSGSPGPGPYTANVTPPLNAVIGTTRMRIRVVRDETPLPCGASSSGAVEDYAIEIVKYCDASAGCGQYISRIQLADIDNTTGCDSYSFYNTIVPDLYTGQEYPITITINNAYSGNNGSLWVDWNHDMDFFDTGERIPLSPYWGTGPYTATIVPPLDAEAGHTRMRVRLHREIDLPEPCESEPFGEVEDYVLNVVESTECQAQGGCDEYISSVQFGDIDNASGCTIGYSDYSDLSTEIHIGGTAEPITITIGNPESIDQCGLWIDWNRDLDFDDTDESIALSGSPGTGPYTATITPPFNVIPGESTMRVRLVRGSTPLPCGFQSRGEVEDYTVIVPDPEYCIGSGGCGEHIGHVQMGDIDNISGCSLGYSDYTHLSTTVIPDQPSVLTVTAGLSYPGDNCTVFIDWNHDLDFDDDGEEILMDGSPGPGPYTTTIIPRPEVESGETRMRIRLDFEDPDGPCTERDLGEVEDYTINVMQCQLWDLVCDGCVNMADFAIFSSHWLQTPCSSPVWCGGADLNTSGNVNLVDLSILAAHWLEGCQ